MKNVIRTISTTPHLILLPSLVLILMTTFTYADDTDTRIWTAREAVIFALQNSPDSRIAAQRISAAEAQLNMAESSFRPRLNLSAGYDQTNNPIYSFGNIGHSLKLH